MEKDRLRNWGISRSYTDWEGRRRVFSAASISAVLQAMDAGSLETPPASPVVAAFRGERTPLRGEIALEGGGRAIARGRLPASVPEGYHTLDDGRLLIVAPRRCAPAPQGWGWAVQLYSLLSGRSRGIGDLGDLRRLGEWAAGLGAAVTLVSPLHASLPGSPQEPSPYFPSSRRYRNPLYLRVEGLPVGLNSAPLVDREAVLAAKLAALERQWRRGGDAAGFRRYRRSEGAGLERFATFNALYERHGPGWRAWPDGHDRPDSPGTRRFARENRERVDFHAWLQWQLDAQLADAAGPLPLVNDLAVGVDPDGADAWTWQEVFASGVTVGAPPDEFNMAGQSWGLPPFDPWKLRSARYEPFIRTLRSALRHSGGVRVDHVMGLFRLWWIPPGRGPAAGAYVTYPSRDLLAILALESSRAGSFVVGEDLGTVSRQVRAELRRRGVLSYRLLWFEKDPPSGYPEQALAAATTHDLPTIAGLWTGADLDAQRRAGLRPNERSTREIAARLAELTGLGPKARVADVVEQTYRVLSEAPSSLLAATLEDAALAEERPNLPGTLDEWPNWRIRLPLSLEELEAAELPRRIAAALRRR